MTERIIITFNSDGSFRGASASDFGGLPVPLQPADLEALAPSINAAMIATIAAKDAERDEAIAAKDAEIEVLKGNPPPMPQMDNDLVTQLDSFFRERVPAELLQQLAIPYAVVRFLVKENQMDLAVAAILSIPIPEELIADRDALLSLIPAA